MDVIEFANKAGYIENGLLKNKTYKEVEKLFKENIKNQKKYFSIKTKMKKDIKLSDLENRFMYLYAKDIIW